MRSDVTVTGTVKARLNESPHPKAGKCVCGF